MRLADIRKLAIRNRQRIRFEVPGGRECVVNEHGIAQVPGLSGPTDLNLEESVAAAARFVLEPAVAGKAAAAPRTVTREQVAAMVSAGGPEAPQHDDHDE